MSIAEKYRPHYTYDDYCLWEGRWELIEGMPYAMSPAPTPRHQMVLTSLVDIFFNGLKRCPDCRVFVAPLDWKINNTTVVQPDLLIICKPIEKKYLDFSPSLVAEVISPSTAEKDRIIKYEIYKEAGVKYYLLIEPVTNKITSYTLADKEYVMQKPIGNSYQFHFDEKCSPYFDFENLWV